MADTTAYALAQGLISVIIYGLTKKGVERKQLQEIEQGMFPSVVVEEFDLEDEFNAKIWTQFVRDDADIFTSTIAESVAITNFSDSVDNESTPLSVTQLLEHSSNGL